MSAEANAMTDTPAGILRAVDLSTHKFAMLLFETADKVAACLEHHHNKQRGCACCTLGRGDIGMLLREMSAMARHLHKQDVAHWYEKPYPEHVERLLEEMKNVR